MEADLPAAAPEEVIRAARKKIHLSEHNIVSHFTTSFGVLPIIFVACEKRLTLSSGGGDGVGLGQQERKR